MKAILINVEDEMIEEVELKNPDTTRELQDLVGGYISCGWTWYDDAGFPKNVLYVDEEGMMKGYQKYFRILNADKLGKCNPCGPTHLYGNGVILGVNREGESADTTIEKDNMIVEVLEFVANIGE